MKDTSVNGVEGLNVNVAWPFKFQEYVVGFRYALGNLKTAPESLFARRKFDVADGELSVEGDYTLDGNLFKLGAKWASEKLGLTLGLNADTNDRLTSVDAKKTLNVQDTDLTLSAAYDLIKKKACGKAEVQASKTLISLKYDTEGKDPELEVSHDLDANNVIIPTLSLKNAAISYGYKRNYKGGSVKARLFPGDKVTAEWKDEGASGTWITSADIPLEDTKGTKISFSREWNY